VSNYSFSDDLISDLHKDAYGFRPKGDYFAWWESCSADEKQAEWDRLHDAFIAREESEREMEAEDIKNLEDRIVALREHGARSREMAVRWLDEAFETNGDISFLEWNLGVPYGYLTKEFGPYFTKKVA
jgi:hypothetical protein